MKASENILITLVLYKQELEKCKTFSSFLNSKKALSIPHQLLVYNNSKEIPISSKKFPNYILYTASENEKLSTPYNYAWHLAVEKGYSWILLLDQDSKLNEDFFSNLSQCIVNASTQTGAIIPTIFSNGKQISPVVLNEFSGPFGLQRPWTPTRQKLKSNEYLNGINSCSLLKTEAISSIGGFSADFPLDFLDYWYFYQLHKKDWEIEVVIAPLDHNLSISSTYNGMGKERYNDYLTTRALYGHKTKLSVLLCYKLRCAAQCIHQLFKFSERKFFWQTFKGIFY